MSHHTIQVVTLIVVTVAAVFSFLNVWMQLRRKR